MININADLKPHSEAINNKLIRRLKMFAAILVIMTLASLYEVLAIHINFLWVPLGFALGLGLGALVGRTFSIEWDKEKNEVIGRLDMLGVVVLVLYTVFSMIRHWIFAHWFVGGRLSVFTLSFIGGVMLGRLLNLRFHIKKVLLEQGRM